MPPAPRSLLAGLLLGSLVLLAPAATAQSDLVDEFELTLDSIEGPIRPLSQSIAIPFVLEAACGMAQQGTTEPVQVRFEIHELPSWAEASLSPSVAYLPRDCSLGSRVTVTGEVTASVHASAPAFVPGFIKIGARSDARFSPREAEATSEIVPDFYSILDASAHDTVRKVRANESAEFSVSVANHGNAPLRVNFAIENLPQDFSAEPPASILLGSRGEPGSQTTISFVVKAPATAPLSGHIGVVELLLTSHHADDPDLEGDTTRISFLVDARGADIGFDAPGAPATLALLGVVALAVLARRRSSRCS